MYIFFQAQLGVGISNKALLFVILSPCASYFDSGTKPLRLMADANYVRAWIGGAGDRKIGSNYGPTIYVQVSIDKDKYTI